MELFISISKLTEANYLENYYLLDTIIDSLYSSLLDAENKLIGIYYDHLEKLSKPSDWIDCFIFSFVIIDLFICLIFDIIVIAYIKDYQIRTMDVFLELPRRYVVYLNSRCESYATELLVSEFTKIIEY